MRYCTQLLTAAPLFLCLAGGAAAQTPIERQDEGRIEFDLPAQDLGKALQAIALLSGDSVIARAEIVADRDAPAVRGRLTIREALERVLDGSGLQVRSVGDTFVIEPVLAEVGDPVPANTSSAGSEIVVTGTRLRGTAPASTVITVEREAIHRAGHADLGEVARSLPQSFGGGQNPGIGFNVPRASGINVGSGASFNLRGLGSDATLTLLNGKRLPYSSSAQSIDVSAIPIMALDRIEIVPDGSSALYGSDAVAGVVNIILRERVEGVETSARLGASTEGGNFQQNYSAIVGTGWSSGSGFVAYEFENSSAIRSSMRDYASSRPGLTLVPPSRNDRVLANLEQELPGGIVFDLDALYHTRASDRLFATNPAGDLSVSRTRTAYDVETYALAPTLAIDVGSWRLSLEGTYGSDVTDFEGRMFSETTLTGTSGGRYTNRSRSLEVGGSGEIFALPAGPVSLAAGAGLRINDFRLFRGAGELANIDTQQRSRFAYAEVGIPIVAPASNTALIHRLELNAALRHERYRGIGSVTTPKVGLVFAPFRDLTFKASWGRSFRAPTFIQQFQVRQSVLLPTALFSNVSFPDGSTALVIFGGNPDLAPERARSWSFSTSYRPGFVPGLSVEASYFSTRYIDRIVNPVPFLALALSDPLYAGQVTRNPTQIVQANVIEGSNEFLNLTGAPYDPQGVVALVDTSNRNAGLQDIRGVDLLFRYDTEIGVDQNLSFSGNVSYLDSEQRLSELQPVRPLAGQLFNPPHWQARGSATWRSGPVTASAFLSRIGGVSDPRTQPAQSVRGMTTLDLSGSYQVPATTKGILGGLSLGLTVQNLFNAEPVAIATTSPTDTPYDSTNYSPAGRVISIRVAKKW